MWERKINEDGNGHVGARAGVDDGEGIVEVSIEGIDECSRKVIRGEVGLKVSWKDVCNLGNDVVLDAIEFNGEVVRKARRIAEGGVDAITGIYDGPV